jgi:hypothetical protein
MVETMKFIWIFLSVALFSSFLFADSLCKVQTNINASKKDKIQCRCVCDKKLSEEQKMAEAIKFYKNSKNYNFANYSFFN